MEQFEQLLTCAICLDRYRNPKLLPCQHSFCMEPCMDGLVDYVRRQVKCPECRAEHRIPYQGVQGFPTNVTLQRFLELHIEITGELPDPTSGQIMERCSVCSEKSYCSLCVHCDKKVCADCKGAHMDILRREITRINNQVRRGIHRLQDALSLVEKNQITLLSNCTSVTEEIDEIYRRLNKALKDRTESLRSEIERYQSTEQRNLRTLKDNLEQELSNIQSNCDLADKHMNDNVDWDDCELMDAKEIFLKTVEFIRNFEYENVDYTRRVRFSMATDPNQLVLHVANYGDLTIASPYPSMAGPGVGGGGGGGGLLQPPAAGPGLMRSKSDHRLASQFRQEERGGYFDGEGGGPSAGGRASPLGGRKFGERYSSRGYGGGESSRYGRGGDDYSRGGGGGDYEYDEGGGSGGRASRRYRSRLASRHLGGGDGDSDNDAVGVGGRSVRFSGDCGGGGGGGPAHHAKERERVLDTEDASRGPLSGITRLLDSPRVMKRLQESEQRGKKRDKEPAPAPAPQAAPKAATAAPARRAPAARQVSEDDEISKIKKQNKASGSGVEAAATTAAAADTTTTTTTTTTSSARPQSERVAALKQQRSTDAASEESSSSADQARRTPPATVQEVATSDGESDDTSSAAGANTTTSAQRKTSTGTATGAGRRTSDAGSKKPAVRSASSESSTSSESSSSAAASPVRTTAPASTTANAGGDSSGASTPRGRGSSAGSDTQPRFQSRFLANRQQAAAAAAAAASSTKEEDEDEDETESSSDSEETDSEEESEDEAAKKKPAEPASTSTSSTRAVDRTDIGPLLARSAHARDSSDAPTASSRRRDSRDEGGSSSAGYRRYSTDASSTPSYRYGANKDKDKEETGSKYLSRSRAAQQDDDTPSSRYGSSGYTSRFLNKSKSSAALSPEEDSDSRKYGAGSSTSAAAGGDDSSSRYPSGRSRYAALKDRRSRLARSRSSHNFGGDDQDDQDDSPSSPTSSGMPASYLPSRYAAGSSTADLARSRSTHALKSRENSPERPTASGSGASGSGEKDGAALSSWARYLKNKYGNRGKDGKDGASASASGSSLASGAGSSAAASRRLSLGLPLRHNSASIESSDDDQKNPAGSPTSPTAAGFAAAAGTSPRSQYLQKRRQLFKIGSRGSEPGNFTWPRGIAVGPDNSIVVADSSNHRVQVFDANGTFVKEFGSYGSGEGEFDCLAGVAVNRIGQFIIADRYNHRIQVMDPSGRFLRAFGSQGSSDGRFNYPWGVTTDALGFIYVCDKENHRVQVFQSDGTFVGKFGSSGNKPGQLEHPHYIAVSNTNRVIVSDSNNHRVQIFDVNGKVVTTFGNEGSEDGQFKFPRHAKRAKSSRPRGSHHSHRAITTKSTKPVTSNTSTISTSAPSTIAIKQGRRSGRPGLHLRGGLRQQPHPNLQPRRHIPESIRLLGIRGRGVQRTGGYSSYIQRQHPGMRSREPSHTSVLSSTVNKRLNFNTAGNLRELGPLRRASLPIIQDRFLTSPVSLTYV